MKKILKNNILAIGFGSSLAFVIGGFAWAFFVLRSSGSTSLILHFSDTQGITEVGGIGTYIFIGIFALLVVLMNFAVAREFEARGRFLGKFLAAMTFIFALLLFLAFAAIINVNV